MIGITEYQIRDWEKEFNIQVPRTAGGHRRYTQENIEIFTKVKEKMEVNGWGIPDVRDWLNGAATPKVIQDLEVRTTVEKKITNLQEEVEDMKEIIKKQNELLRTLTEQQAMLPRQITNQIMQDYQDKLADGAFDDILKIQQTRMRRIESSGSEEAAVTKEVKKVNWFSKLFKHGAK